MFLGQRTLEHVDKSNLLYFSHPLVTRRCKMTNCYACIVWNHGCVVLCVTYCQ